MLVVWDSSQTTRQFGRALPYGDFVNLKPQERTKFQRSVNVASVSYHIDRECCNGMCNSKALHSARTAPKASRDSLSHGRCLSAFSTPPVSSATRRLGVNVVLCHWSETILPAKKTLNLSVLKGTLAR